jgi:hypothetical protein
VSKTLTEIIKTTTQETYDEGYAAGRAYQAGKDMGKVELSLKTTPYLTPGETRDLISKIKAALDEAAGEE